MRITCRLFSSTPNFFDRILCPKPPISVSMDAPGKNWSEYVCICYADVCERVCVVSECERVNEVDLHVYIHIRARSTSIYPDGV